MCIAQCVSSNRRVRCDATRETRGVACPLGICDASGKVSVRLAFKLCQGNIRMTNIVFQRKLDMKVCHISYSFVVGSLESVPELYQ